MLYLSGATKVAPRGLAAQPLAVSRIAPMAFNVKSPRRSERVLCATPTVRSRGHWILQVDGAKLPSGRAFLGSCVRDFGYSGVEESGSAASILMSAVMAFETSFMLATGIRASFPCPSET